jgi:hypothetical protein
MERRIDGEALLPRLLQVLSEEEWQVFVLMEVEGMSGPKVAKELGMPLGTVYSRHRRAHARIDAERDRMKAADRRRTGMFVGPAFALSWRDPWARLWTWLDRRLLVGAVTGGAVVYWLLQPAARPPAPIVEVPAERAAVSGAASVDGPLTGEGGAMKAATSVSTVAGPAGVAAHAGAGQRVASSAPAGLGSAAPAGPAARSGVKAARSPLEEKERAADWSALAALEAALVLLRNGHCDEAGKRLAPHAARLAAGPLAPEYQVLQRQVRACSR